MVDVQMDATPQRGSVNSVPAQTVASIHQAGIVVVSARPDAEVPMSVLRPNRLATHVNRQTTLITLPCASTRHQSCVFVCSERQELYFRAATRVAVVIWSTVVEKSLLLHLSARLSIPSLNAVHSRLQQNKTAPPKIRSHYKVRNPCESPGILPISVAADGVVGMLRSYPKMSCFCCAPRIFEPKQG